METGIHTRMSIDTLNRLINTSEREIQDLNKMTEETVPDKLSSLENSLSEFYKLREEWLSMASQGVDCPINISEDEHLIVGPNNLIDKLELKLKFDRVKELHDNRLFN